MAIDWSSFLQGSIVTIMLVLIGIFIVLGLIFGKLKDQLKYILGKFYSRTSLLLIALIDTIAIFDPTQTLFGLALAPVAAIIVFGVEWGLHDKLDKKKIFPAIIAGLVAGVLISLPFNVAGLFVAWFGVVGDKKRKAPFQ